MSGTPTAFLDLFVPRPQGRLHVRIIGEGMPLLLLHSVGCSAHEFDDAARILARHFQVICWDMPGHGDSDHPSDHVTIGGHAHTVIEVLDRLDIERCHIGGASIGGVIALEAARLDAKRVASLMLIETGLQSEERWAAMWDIVERTFAVPTQEETVVASRLFRLTSALLERWNIDRNKAGGHAMMSAMWALRQYRFEQALSAVTMPTLLLYGDKSPVGPSLGVAAAAIPHAQQLIMANCGHFPMLDDPEGFAAALDAFIPRY